MNDSETILWLWIIAGVAAWFDAIGLAVRLLG